MKILSNFLKHIISVVKRKGGTDSKHAGNPIEPEGVGDTYSELYYVGPTTHKFEKGDYETEFEMKRSQVSD